MDALSLMFQNGLKNQAAYALPQQLQTEQQAALEKLKADQLANAQSEAMNPLNQLFRQGEINQQGANLAETQARLPGVMGTAQSLAAQGQVDQATTGDRIAERKSSLNNQVGVNQAQTLAREGQVASMIAAALPQYIPSHHEEVASAMFDKFGIPESSPVRQVLAHLRPEQIQTGLAHLGDGMVKASGDFVKQQALQTQELKSREGIAGGNNATSIRVAEIGAQARTQAAQLRAQQMASTMGIDKTIAMYERQKAQGGLAPEEEQALQALKYQQLSAKAVGANDTAANVLKTPGSMDKADVASRGPGAPPAAPPAAQAPDLGAAAQKLWGSYDPQSYDYRVGPNGNLQRKPKR